MVDIEEMEEEATTTTTPSQSQERLLDAEEIEKVAATMTRPTAQMHLTALAKKLRKEGEALKRVEANIAKTTTEQQEQPVVQPQEPPPTTSAKTTKPVPSPVAAVPPTVVLGSSVKFTPIDRFSFDAGSYNTPFITLYVPLPGVGSIPKANVVCDFGKDSLNLVVTDLNGKSYRLIKDCLEKDIVPDKSKCIIKANEIRIKLAKVKGEYGSYDYWSKLTDPKKHDKKKSGGAGAASSSDNPTAGIMDLMKDMYDSGDDNMKKMIGETMMKQRNGELTDPMSMGGMGGMGGSKKKGGGYGMGLDDLNMDDEDDD
jgi:calcyclin binding protein